MPPLRVFAVEPTAVQLDWHALAEGDHELAVGAPCARVRGGTRPGAVRLDGLEPGRSYPVVLDGARVGSASTLVPPPGPVLARIATLNDLHLGEVAFGILPRYRSHPDPARAHPVWCLRAALAEIRDWDPDLVVIKGDLADDNRPGQYALVAEALTGFPVPLVLLPGNHDGGNHHHRGADAAIAHYGLDLVRDVAHVDLPGIRVVAANSVWPLRDRGRLTPRLPAITQALREAPGPVLLATHHQIMRTPVPTYLPPGLLGAEAKAVLAAVAAANPATLVTTGHSHRHRRRHHGPVVITEVGSPKDHPGTWTGYSIYETGVIQTVRRIADPATIAWTERTARTALTMWGRWSPGRLDDRCFTHLWPPR